MKKELLTFFLILVMGVIFSFRSQAQIATNTEAKDSTNIYYQSLKIYLNYLDSIKVNYSDVFIEKNTFTTSCLPEKMGKFNIVCLNQLEVRKKLGSHKIPIELIRIVELRVKNGEFFVNVIPFKVTYQKKNFSFINSGGKGIIFSYKEEQHNFMFLKIKHGNI